MEALNQDLFILIGAGAEPAIYAYYCALFLAVWPLYGVPVLLTGFWLYGTQTVRRAALAATFSIALGLMSNKLIGLAVFHPRPFMIGLGGNWLDHAVATSFPSNHAVIFFALGLALVRYSLPKTGILICLIGVFVGWARIYLNAHFPLDIIGGLLVASLCVTIIHYAMQGPGSDRLMEKLEAYYRTLFAFPIRKRWVRR